MSFLPPSKTLKLMLWLCYDFTRIFLLTMPDFLKLQLWWKVLFKESKMFVCIQQTWPPKSRCLGFPSFGKIEKSHVKLNWKFLKAKNTCEILFFHTGVLNALGFNVHRRIDDWLPWKKVLIGVRFLLFSFLKWSCTISILFDHIKI